MSDVRPPPSRTAALGLAILLAVGALAVVLAAVRSPLFDLDRHQVPKALALEVVALVSLLALLPGWRRIEGDVVDVLLAAFLAWSGISAVLARNHWLALSGFGLGLCGYIVFLAARSTAPAQGRFLAGALAAAGAAGAALGVAQAYGADWWFLAQTRPPGATFGNRNFLAHLTAISLPLLLLVRLRAGTALGRWATFLALVIDAAAIVLTRSRAAWLALAVALAVVLAASLVGRGALRGRARSLRGALLAVAIGAGLAVVLPNQLDWRSSSPYAETFSRLADYSGGSGRGRLIQYSNSARLLAKRPIFGVGPGNWFVQYPRVTTPGDPAFDPDDPIPTNPWPSSDWVTFLVERGPIGTLLLLLAGFTTAIGALFRVRGPDPDEALDGIALLGVLSAAVVAGAFDAVLLLPAPLYFVAVATGALRPRSDPILSRPLAAGRRVLISAALVLLVLGTTLYSAGQLTAIVLTRDSTSRATVDLALRFDPGNYRLDLLMMKRGSCHRRLPYARAAASLMPYHPAPRRALRECGAHVPKG